MHLRCEELYEKALAQFIVTEDLLCHVSFFFNLLNFLKVLLVKNSFTSNVKSLMR